MGRQALALEYDLSTHFRRGLDLFDNVISPEASEDVVGISKKMLQTLIDDLAGVEPVTVEDKVLSESLEVSVQVGDDQAQAVKKQGAVEAEDEGQIRQLIEKIQTTFNSRIVRILGSGGGLLVVVNQQNDADEESAQSLSELDVPIVVIDSRTLAGLQRLGAASPVRNPGCCLSLKLKIRKQSILCLIWPRQNCAQQKYCWSSNARQA
jgi:hypothetical protein